MTDASTRAIGRRIAEARRGLGLTQREFARTFGVTTRMLQYYEAGAIVPYRYLERLAKLTGREPRWFLEGDRPGAAARAGGAADAAQSPRSPGPGSEIAPRSPP